MLAFTFWDVQHGSATYIRTPGGKNIVIDLGVGSFGYANQEFSPLMHLKNNYGIEQLDAVIITHPHRDHIDDIFNFDNLSPQVLRRPSHLTESEIKSGNRQQDSEIIDKYLEISNRYNSPISPERSPFNPENNGGVTFQFFQPRICLTSNLNNHSLVTVISYAHSKIIIPGDNEAGSWHELIQREDFASAIEDTYVFVTPHHGRQSGYSPELFDSIHPYLAIISDGRFIRPLSA